MKHFMHIPSFLAMLKDRMTAGTMMPAKALHAAHVAAERRSIFHKYEVSKFFYMLNN